MYRRKPGRRRSGSRDSPWCSTTRRPRLPAPPQPRRSCAPPSRCCRFGSRRGQRPSRRVLLSSVTVADPVRGEPTAHASKPTQAMTSWLRPFELASWRAASARASRASGVLLARVATPTETVNVPPGCISSPGNDASRTAQLLPRLRMCSRIWAQSGQIGYFEGSRLGTHTLPHRALTGMPST